MPSVEFRPEDVGEPPFGMARLERKEAAQAPLSPGADQQIDGWDSSGAGVCAGVRFDRRDTLALRGASHGAQLEVHGVVDADVDREWTVRPRRHASQRFRGGVVQRARVAEDVYGGVASPGRLGAEGQDCREDRADLVLRAPPDVLGRDAERREVADAVVGRPADDLQGRTGTGEVASPTAIPDLAPNRRLPSGMTARWLRGEGDTAWSSRAGGNRTADRIDATAAGTQYLAGRQSPLVSRRGRS